MKIKYITREDVILAERIQQKKVTLASLRRIYKDYILYFKY